MIKLGLIGFPLGHSFSKNYYASKFEKEGISDIDYDLYPMEDVLQLQALILKDSSFKGFNVTIPHKQAILTLISNFSEEAKEIGAVNCITVHRLGNGITLTGYNTDAFGFQQSLSPLLNKNHQRALVLGNGGAAKAVFFALKKLQIPYTVVSRNRDNGDMTYKELNSETIKNHQLIVNCSPIGTFPNVDQCPDIPYQYITADHLLYDLIYNPEETLFLKKGKEKGAAIKNGYEMLVLQAEKNWQIWQKNF